MINTQKMRIAIPMNLAIPLGVIIVYRPNAVRKSPDYGSTVLCLEGKLPLQNGGGESNQDRQTWRVVHRWRISQIANRNRRLGREPEFFTGGHGGRGGGHRMSA